jgi:hypothetical protein
MQFLMLEELKLLFTVITGKCKHVVHYALDCFTILDIN